MREIVLRLAYLKGEKSLECRVFKRGEKFGVFRELEVFVQSLCVIYFACNIVERR